MSECIFIFLQKRCFSYIDDCLDSMECIILKIFKTTINIGPDEVVTIKELAGYVLTK